MKDQTNFSNERLDDIDFKSCLVGCNDNTQAKCKLCKKAFVLFKMGRKVLSGTVLSVIQVAKNTNFMIVKFKYFLNLPL